MTTQYLVQFREGVGWAYDTEEEALLAACEFVLERAEEEIAEDPDDKDAREMVVLLSQGQMMAALNRWNLAGFDPVLIRKVDRRTNGSEVESLRTRAREVLEPPDPPPPLGLASAISHARHQAKSLDPKCARDHAQLADWLEDLSRLEPAIRIWASQQMRYTHMPKKHERALLEILQDLKGHYAG